MASQHSVYLFDLWKTLGFSIDRDPILNVQEALGHNVEVVGGSAQARLDREFMRVCLTTDIPDPVKFLNHVARTFGLKADAKAHALFAELNALERGGFQLFPETEQALTELRNRGIRLGLISNLWPFAVEHIFDGCGLGQYFEHRIYSFDIGFKKPEPEMFREACERFHVNPEDCLMVGDNPVDDVGGALSVGMNAALIDRTGKAKLAEPRAVVITSLLDLTAPDFRIPR